MPQQRALPTEPMLQAALAALPENLGLTFTKAVDLDAEDGPCEVLTVTWEGGRRTLRIHTQQIHRAEDLGHLKARLAHPDDVLLLTPHLTANLGRKCLDLGLQFMDMAGNIHLTGQGLHVVAVGNKLASKTERLGPVRPFKAFNHKGLQVVFALLAGEGLAGATYRELGRAAGVATGTVGLVMQDLTTAGLMVATPTGRAMLQPDRLVEGWVANFPHKLRPHLHPTRFLATHTEGWKNLDLTPHDAQWGGEVAGDRLTHHLQPRTATIYTRDNAAKLAGALRLRPDPQGDIEILDQFWDFPTPQGYPLDVVPPLLIYADLVASGDPRNTDIARMIHAHHLHPEQPRP